MTATLRMSVRVEGTRCYSPPLYTERGFRAHWLWRAALHGRSGAGVFDAGSQPDRELCPARGAGRLRLGLGTRPLLFRMAARRVRAIPRSLDADDRRRGDYAAGPGRQHG